MVSYSSPHHVRDYVSAACLFLNHDYCLRCQRRAEKDKRALLKSTREIDLCARIASLLGPTCHLAAQGTSDRDLENEAPKFRVEVKYIHPGRTNWPQVKADWDWLLAVSNNGEEFRKRAVVFFWPSTSLHKLTSCLSVTRGHGTQFSQLDFAPLTPFAEPEMPQNGVNQRLRWKSPTAQAGLGLQLPGGKRVQVDLIGSMSHPLWASVYSRLTPDEYDALPNDRRIAVTDAPIVC